MTTPLQHVRRASSSHRTRRPFLVAALIAAMGLLLAPAVASAHAHLVQADPAPNGVVAHAPSIARFTFDEPLNPTLTRVRITDAAGRAVASARGSLAPGHDHELWLLPLPALKPGTYSVYWTSESATDGHVISSFYTFRVAPSGGAGGAGAVTGAAAGSYGGGGGSASSGSDLLPGGGVIATALLHALGLMAQALWLGALVVELFVLAPARRSAARSPAARLARIATPRLWRLGEGALLVTLLALAGEVVSISLQGTGGDWAQALSPATLGGLLSSQNGHATLARFAVLLIAIALTTAARVPAFSETAAAPLRQPRRARQALGIVATPPGALVMPRWETTRLLAVLLAAVYMVLVALSGHAADVTPGLYSYPVDWLHLVCTAAWAGGIAALAYGVMPARRALSHEARAAAVLPLLDRFSPIAYVSVAALALSGLYNAVNHVAAPHMMVDTAYGILLIVKIVLVGLLILASASHVYGLRPRILRAQALERDSAAAAVVHEGLATLAARLRLETWVGAGILLATALMTQTLPPSSAVSAQGASPAATATPASISGTAVAGDLSARLTVTPPAVGTATFALTIQEKGTAITGDTGAAIVHLYPLAHPDQRATLDPTATGTRFAARGSLPATGTWRADVLVRTATVNSYRTLAFTFTAGPGAGFLSAAQAAVTLEISPGHIGVPNTVTIDGVQAAGVRIVSEAIDMRMGTVPYTATKRGHGTWRVLNVYPLMNGRWALTVQVRKSVGGAWIPLRRFTYQVPATGAKMKPISSQALSATAATSGRPKGARLVAPAAVSWARLPYPAVVTFYNNGLAYVPGLKSLVSVGKQNHSVARAPDGTYWVTDYVGNDVAVLDGHSGAILARIPVGLYPAHMAFTPDGRRAYVSNMFSNDVSVIDVHARRVVTTIALQNAIGPHGLAMSPDGSQVWVPCGTAGGMWVIDTRTNKVAKIVMTGGFPHAVTFSPDGKTAYMTDATQAPNSTLMVVDTATGNKKATVRIGTGSAMVVVSRDGRQVFVSGQSGSEVTVVDAATLRVVKRVPVGKAPHGMALTPDGRYLYVAVNDADHVAVLDTRTDRVIATVPVPGGADELALVR